MKRRLAALTLAATTALTGACGLLTPPAALPTPTTAPTPPAFPASPDNSAGNSAPPVDNPRGSTPPADSGLGSVKDAGDLPNPCTLLMKAQVAELTGRTLIQVDEDGAEPGAATRYCQWQQESGQLVIFVTRTTPADFAVTTANAEPVTGVGDDGYWHSGHLFVLHGTVQLDVYSRGGSDAENLVDAKEVATTLLPAL